MSGNPNREAGKATGRATPGAVAAVDPPGSNKTAALDTPKSATGSRRLARSGQGRHKGLGPRTGQFWAVYRGYQFSRIVSTSNPDAFSAARICRWLFLSSRM